MIMKWFIRYPCSKCLVDTMCKEPCQKFATFMDPVDGLTENIGNFIEKIDDKIDINGPFQKPFDYFGEHIFTPVFDLFVFITYGIKVEKTARDKFEARYTKWYYNKDRFH